MLSAPAEEEEAGDEEDEEEVASSKAEPYRMGRRLLMGSAGPTRSAPGRAVYRADRRAEVREEEDEEVEDVAEVDATEDAKVRRVLVFTRERDVMVVRATDIVVGVSIGADMMIAILEDVLDTG